jgi:uncharacterized repeat protein (TIGR03803 family)
MSVFSNSPGPSFQPSEKEFLVTHARLSQERISTMHVRVATAAFAFAVVLAILATQSTQAQTFTVLHTLTGADGYHPAGLVRDSAGNLYGVNASGGASCCGTVFKVDTTDKFTVLYNFTAGADGAEPMGTLIRDSAGNLYGTANAGGDTTTGCLSSDGIKGCGTIFKLTMGGHLHVLHTFKGGKDGANPSARLFRTAGNFYGTTFFGGVKGCRTYGCGTVFKLDTTGRLTVLHAFTGGQDGAYPNGRVILDFSGNLYGTTSQGGGPGCGSGGCGVVFKLSPSGNLTVLHHFAGYPTDGAYPYAGLQWDGAGNMYGTTFFGGAVDCNGSGDGCGTVFKIRTNGAEVVLHSFDGIPGQNPVAGVIVDGAGNLYGVSQGDSRSNFGAVFKLDKAGSQTILHEFTGGSDGADPAGTLIRDAAGNLIRNSQRSRL